MKKAISVQKRLKSKKDDIEREELIRKRIIERFISENNFNWVDCS